MLSYVALGVIFFLLVLITVASVLIVSLPGKIARTRGHPWPDAVNAASWIGVATGVFWPVAFIWAWLPLPHRSQVRTDGTTQPRGDTVDLAARVASLEATIKKLESQVREDAS